MPLTEMRLLLTLFLLAASLSCFPQTRPADDTHASLLSGKKRSLIAYAGAAHSFTLETSVTAKPSDVPGFITIDRQILQATLVPIGKNIDLRHSSPAREQDLLTRYMNFELSYYKKKLHEDYTNLQTEWVTLQNHIFLIWSFDVPQNDKLISRQVYVSTIFFDRIMDLNAPVFQSDDPEKAKALLLHLAGTLKTYDAHLDLKAMQKKL